MSKYKWLEQKLHQIALSSQFMREVTFDFETACISSSNKFDNHIFITGLARGGTTTLLNALYQANLFASLCYCDMPFVLAPNLWSKIYNSKKDLVLKERAHGDGIKISLKSPEAFEEVFWKTFYYYSNEDLNKQFRIYIRNILFKYKKTRYLSKNNQNIRRIELITTTFQNSKIFIPFREPIQHSYSLLNQHKKFIEESKNDNFISRYMKWIGHTEFGPNYIPIQKINIKYKNFLDINHWIEQWYLTYKNAFQTLQKNPNINFICYEKLCSSREYWLKIQEIAQIKNTYDFEFKESKKDISLNIDKELRGKALSLYFDLNGLNLT